MSSPLWRFVNQQPTRTAGAAAGWVQMAPGVPCCLSSRNAPISSIVDGRLPPADASIRFHEESGEACPNHHQIDFAEVSMNRKLQPGTVTALLVVVLLTRPSMAQDQPTKVAVNWDKVIRVSQTTPTLQVVVNPPLQRGTPVHHNAFKSLHDLQADYVRYVPWLPYPKLGVAELEPPKDGKTSWDFSAIDPIMKEVADYYARLLAWYTSGGFTDEFGKHHESGYHYPISHWEVLNEVEFEHHIDPETYTRLYDAVV